MPLNFTDVVPVNPEPFILTAVPTGAQSGVKLPMPVVTAMVRVTGIVTGVLVAPVAEIVIVPLYVPAVRPVMLTEAVTVAGAVPEVGLRLSQVALSLALKLSVPPP